MFMLYTDRTEGIIIVFNEEVETLIAYFMTRHCKQCIKVGTVIKPLTASLKSIIKELMSRPKAEILITVNAEAEVLTSD